jgi:hypothetical protein
MVIFQLPIAFTGRSPVFLLKPRVCRLRDHQAATDGPEHSVVNTCVDKD